MKSSVYASGMLLALSSTAGFSAGETFQKLTSYSTEHFLIEADSAGANPADTDNDRMVITGKPGGEMPVTTGTDKCGSYYNGSSYVASTTFTGDLDETRVILLDTTAAKNGRIPDTAFFVGSRPSPGKKNTGLSVYKENSNDDGKCVESLEGSNVTFYKIEATMD